MAEKARVLRDSVPQYFAAGVEPDAGVPPGYKRTEVGVIPEEWEVKTLSDVGDITTGPFGTLLNASEYSWTDGTPIISVGEIKNGYIAISEKTPLASKKLRKRLPQYIIRTSDIVFARKGGVDRSALVDTINDGWFMGSDSMRLRPMANYFGPYISYAIQSDRIKNHMLQNAIGTTMPSLNQTVLRGVVLPIPNTGNEQRAIADALSDADALVAALDKLIAKKRAIKAGAMEELLSGNSKPYNTNNPWLQKSLGEVADIDPESLGGDTDPDYQFVYIALEDVDFGSLKGFSSQVFRSAPSRARRVLRKGDILVSTVRPNLKSHLLFALNTEKWICSTGFSVVRCREDVSDAGFIFHSLFGSYISRQIDTLIVGSNYPAINSNDVVSLRLFLPPLPEQRAIAAILSDMDAEIAALEARRDKAARIKEGMMEALLTGRIRLVDAKATTLASGKRKSTPADGQPRGHNRNFNDAVLIAVLARRFGDDLHPLGRKRYTKMSYLFYRHTEAVATGYLKKAAGPYNPSTKYGGAEAIAKTRGYISEHKSGAYAGFVAGEKNDEALGYFMDWYGKDALSWLDRLRYEKNDTLELWATVDMAMQDLAAEKMEVSVPAVKDIIKSEPEWLPKLDRAVFSDENIAKAIAKSRELFG